MQDVGARDAALIALLRAGGLRRAQICDLDLADFGPATDQPTVQRKRNTEPSAYVTNGAAEALADWLTVRGAEPGPLFCPINKGGRVIPLNCCS